MAPKQKSNTETAVDATPATAVPGGIRSNCVRLLSVEDTKKSPAKKQKMEKKAEPNDKGKNVDEGEGGASDADESEEDEHDPNRTVIVVEHCTQCKSFLKRATQVEHGLENSDVDVVVKPNLDKTRKGCFEIRQQGNFEEERSTDAKPYNHPPLTIRKPVIPFLFLFIALFVLSPTLAERTSTSINFNSEPIVSFGEFVYTTRGHITIHVSSVSINSSTSQPDLSRFGFFLATPRSYYLARMNIRTNPNSCILDSRFIYHLLSFRDLSPPPSSSFNHSFPVFAPGLYTLYFGNCLRETPVSMNLITESYNINSAGVKEFLSVEQTHLPIVLAIFFVTYICLSSFWVYIFLTSKPIIRHIHKSILVLLVIKDFYLICEVADKYSLQFTGVHHGLDMWVTCLEYSHVIVLYSVVVLIATGWRFIKPFLQNREKHMLLVLVFLQLSSTIASVFFAKNHPPSRLEWGFFLTVDGLSCCAILCITFWSVKFLETSHSIMFSDAMFFKVFCFLAVCYIGLSRVIPFFLRNIFVYKNCWVITAAEEMYEFLFLCGILTILKDIGNSAEPIQPQIQLAEREVGPVA